MPQVTYDVHLVNGPTAIQSLTYTARGEVRDLNLRRVGETFQIAALMKPEYDSRISTQFDVKGNGTTLDQIGLDAKGTADGARVYGGTLTKMAYEAHLANGALSGRATGEFRDLDPAMIFGNPRLKGKASGTVDATYSVKNTAAPITPDAITADGRLTLTPSEIGGLKIDAADIQGQYADRRGTLRQMTLKGPDVDLTASGPIALDQTGQTNLKYHVDGDESREPREAREPAGPVRLRHPRRHGDGQWRVAQDRRDPRRIEPRLSGQQGARSQQQVRGDAAGPRSRARAGAGAVDRDVRPGGRHPDQRADRDDDLRRTRSSISRRTWSSPPREAAAASSMRPAP